MERKLACLLHLLVELLHIPLWAFTMTPSRLVVEVGQNFPLPDGGAIRRVNPTKRSRARRDRHLRVRIRHGSNNVSA